MAFCQLKEKTHSTCSGLRAVHTVLTNQKLLTCLRFRVSLCYTAMASLIKWPKTGFIVSSNHSLHSGRLCLCLHALRQVAGMGKSCGQEQLTSPERGITAPALTEGTSKCQRHGKRSTG